jgi:hypothetical protein
MTDPRERLRERRNLHAAAVQLEEGAAAMRANLTPEPVDDESPAPAAPMPPVDGALVPAPFDSERPDPGPRAGEYGDDAPAEPVSDFRTPALTWRPNHDERSRDFGLRQRLTASAPLTNVLLCTGPPLDQGAEGDCVGFGSVDAANVMRLLRSPGTRELLGSTDAVELYRLAQKLDQVPGESYVGTSVLGGMKAGQQAGWWGGYLWAFGTKDIAQALLQRRGPVVIGIPWYPEMYETGPRGVVRVGSGPGPRALPGRGRAAADRPERGAGGAFHLAELLGPVLRGRGARVHRQPGPGGAAAAAGRGRDPDRGAAGVRPLTCCRCGSCWRWA